MRAFTFVAKTRQIEGAHVQGAPACNGWQFWCLDVEGKLVSIDLLREKVRAELS